MVKCTKTLEGYEEKLHLIAKFMSAKRSGTDSCIDEAVS